MTVPTARLGSMGIRPESTSRSRFRGDVEGLRAIAVGLVLIYHADSSLMPGGFVGVDVFFVISGFLITGLLLAEIEKRGRLSLVGFYARRAKRLLPAAAVVLATVAVLTIAFLPKIRWLDVGSDIVSSALYVANWRFAEGAVDYLAQDNAPSPVQHFWSLAVEEQFYLVWPLLLVVAIALSRRAGGRGRLTTKVLLIGLSVVALPSLAWSIYLSDADPGRAYFVTTTRMWELAIGAAVAILAVRLQRIPPTAAAVLAWAGLAAVIGTGLLLTTAAAFPGWIALIPTLGVAAVIAGGYTAGRRGPVVVLGTRPMRKVGALSYSLYLWHWPLLVLAVGIWGELSTAASVAVVIFSVLPAYLTFRWVEDPIRRSTRLTLKPVEALKMGGLSTVAMVVAGMIVVFQVWPPEGGEPYTPAPQIDAEDGTGTLQVPDIGAVTLAADPRGDERGAPTDRVEAYTPSALQARKDVPVVYAQGCHADELETEATACVFGHRQSDFSIALVGDSHAAQWVSPLAQIAVARGWTLRSYTKSSCPLAGVTVVLDQRPYEACTAWNRNVVAELTGADQPDLLITTNSTYRVSADGGSALSAGASRQAMRDGLQQSWSSVAAAGVKVVALADTPVPGVDIAECVSANEDELTACAVARVEAIGEQATLHRDAVGGLPGAQLIDLNDAICPTDRCAAVIGGALVYRDSNHLTDTYARSLAPRLMAELDRVIGG